MYIAPCEIARKKPIGFRPTGCSSVYIQLLTVYIIAPIHLRCNAFFLQSNSFFPFTFLHLSITLLYYSFTILYSPEQLHVCNLPDALVPYIRIQRAARRCSLLFVHPVSPALCIRVYHGGWTASTKSRAILMAELMFVPVCGSFLLLPGH